MPDERPRVHDAPVSPPGALHVTAWGIERGAEYGGGAEVSMRDDAVTLALAAPAGHTTARVYRFAVIDGVRVEDIPDDRALLTIFLRGGDVAELTGPRALRALAQAIEDAACALAEQTLALRALGSPRSRPGSDHDRFFAPLLDARRAAERARGAAGRVGAFDARVMTRRLGDALAAFAAERFPDSAPDRRALEAELRDLAHPALAALDRLGEAAAAVASAGDDVRFARFREWALVLRDVFACTDAAWIASLPALSDSRGRRGRFWRRVLGLRS